MPEVYVCPALAKVVQEIARRVNGGVVPSAITLADVRIYLTSVPTDAMRRHEAKHVEQYKRFRSWWIPPPWKDRVAYARFLAAYYAEHRAKGYQNSRFEVEARAAEAG